LRGIDQPGDFIFREISQARRVCLAKRLDGAPGDIRGRVAVAKGLVQRGAQDGQDTICARPVL
jgi:hypothetical protein